MEKEILVELNNVSKIIKSQWKVRRVELQIYRGEGLALIGKRNSGKEILAGLIDNTLKPTGGTVEYYLNRPKVLESIGIQMPNKSWPMGFKTKDVVELYRSIYGIRDNEWVNELIEVFELRQIWNAELINVAPSWAQLMSLFVAIIHRPEILILEDITSQISLDLRFHLIQFLKRYKIEHNATFILISPDDFVFNELCDRAVVLEKGKIIYDDYKDSWKPDETFETFIQSVIDKIKSVDLESSTDSVVSGAAERFITEDNRLRNIINEYLEPFKDKHKSQIEKWNYELIIELYNVTLFSDYVKRELLRLVSCELTPEELHSMKDSVVKLKKVGFEISDALKHCKELFKDDKSFKELCDGFAVFSKYVIGDLIPFLKDRQALVNGTSSTAQLSRDERRKLKVLKRKYIIEEMKLLKQESRILKKQQQAAKN